MNACRLTAEIIDRRLWKLSQFISTENGDDLIVSFAVIDPADPTEIESLTLLRTPKYEHLLADWERGVSVSFERYVEDDDELLEELEP
jgi:hypothetical protein